MENFRKRFLPLFFALFFLIQCSFPAVINSQADSSPVQIGSAAISQDTDNQNQTLPFSAEDQPQVETSKENTPIPESPSENTTESPTEEITTPDISTEETAAPETTAEPDSTHEQDPSVSPEGTNEQSDPTDPETTDHQPLEPDSDILPMSDEITYTVTYDSNGAESGIVPVDGTLYSEGATVTLKDNEGSLMRANYVFSGWALSASASLNEAINNSFTITENTTLYALWENTGKYVVSSIGTGTEIGRTNTFLEAATLVNSGTESDYLITLLENDEGDGIFPVGISDGKNIILTSGSSGPFYIKNPNESDTVNTRQLLVLYGNLTMENIIFDGNQKGSGVLVSGGKLTMNSGAVIQNCRNVINPGAAVRLYTGGAGQLIMNAGSSIINNQGAKNGGGVEVSSGRTFIMNGGEIKNNTTDKSGGGVLVHGTFIMNGGEISGNAAASQYGGGIGVSDTGLITINGGTVSNNTAIFGGGIYLSNKTATVAIDNATISGNTASTSGGGIFTYTPLAVTNSSILSNKTAIATGNSGGGIDARASINIKSSKIAHNESNDGGGIFLRHTEKTSSIENTTVESNSSVYGGGILLFAGSLTIEDSNINNNSTSKSGGGIFTNGNITINKTAISNNTAATVGGGVDARASSLTISGGTIQGNKALHGGGLYLRNSTSAEVSTSLIDQSSISANEADLGGGTYLYGNVSLTVKDVTISNNKAKNQGGGVYTDDYDYNNPASSSAYQKFTSDNATAFTGNFAGDGLYNPPGNAADFTNISFSSTSVSGQNLITPDHPLNNYDINFTQYFSVIYAGNGANDGIVPVDNTQYNLNDSVIVMDNTGNLLRTGYTFAGWALSADALAQDVITQFNINKDTTLYAVWSINQYTVTYNAMGGSNIASQTVNYNDKFTKPADPTKLHYVFSGWYKEEALNSLYDFNTPATADITLFAKWEEENKYTLIYDANGADSGTAPVDANSPYYKGDQTAVLGQGSMNKTFHVFAGWNTAKDGSGKTYQESNIITFGAENLVLYAQWKESEKYTVTYHSNSGIGNLPKDANYYYLNQEASVLSQGDLSKPGFQFLSWSTKADGTGTTYTPGKKLLITGNMNLYAQWAPEEVYYTITYYANGGHGTAPIDFFNYSYGQTATILRQEKLYRNGYTFIGWNTQPNGKGTSYSAGRQVTVLDNLNLYAQWKNNETGIVEIPNTGDTSNILLWLILVGAALIIIIVLLIAKRRKVK